MKRWKKRESWLCIIRVNSSRKGWRL